MDNRKLMEYMKEKIIMDMIKNKFLEKALKDLRNEKSFEKLGLLSRITQGALMPFIDIYEEEDSIIIIADVAGFSKDDINIEVIEGEDRIKMSGEREKEKFDYIEDGRAREFEKTVYLPTSITGKGEGKMDNGVLKIKLEKRETDKSEIKIK